MANRGGQTGRRNRHYGDSVGNTAVRNLQFIDISNICGKWWAAFGMRTCFPGTPGKNGS